MLCRLIACLLLALWTLYELFTRRVEPLSGIIRFAAFLLLLIGMYYLVNRPVLQQAWPEFAIIFWLSLLIILIASFAGVQPLAQIKDDVMK